MVAACSSDQTCESDADCPAEGSRCDVALARCLCTTSAGCADGERCNAAGVCQERVACRSNRDCPAEGTFCELGSGRCVEGPAQEIGATCSGAVQCPYGAICVNGRCEPGCFDDGDCLLGEVCTDWRCRSDAACTTSDFCPFGSVCQDGRCEADDRGLYCEACPPVTAADRSPCGPVGSLCLLNSYGPGPEAFCGVDCSQDQPCPNGYVCSAVATDTGESCTRDAECPANRACVIGEGRTAGFCACATDLDCPSDRCDENRGVCRRTGVPCDPGGPPCPEIRCIEGACVVGRSCVPEEGLYCDALTAPQG